MVVGVVGLKSGRGGFGSFEWGGLGLGFRGGLESASVVPVL